jgi:hypothetical protein
MAGSAGSLPDLTTDNPPRARRWIPLSLRVRFGILATLAVCAWMFTSAPFTIWDGGFNLVVIGEFEDGKRIGKVVQIPDGRASREIHVELSSVTDANSL